MASTLGDSKGQISLACCSPWRRKDSGAAEQLEHHQQILWALGTIIYVRELALSTGKMYLCSFKQGICRDQAPACPGELGDKGFVFPDDNI